jgi:chromosome segregation ATPase
MDTEMLLSRLAELPAELQAAAAVVVAREKDVEAARASLRKAEGHADRCERDLRETQLAVELLRDELQALAAAASLLA